MNFTFIEIILVNMVNKRLLSVSFLLKTCNSIQLKTVYWRLNAGRLRKMILIHISISFRGRQTPIICKRSREDQLIGTGLQT